MHKCADVISRWDGYAVSVPSTLHQIFNFFDIRKREGDFVLFLSLALLSLFSRSSLGHGGNRGFKRFINSGFFLQCSQETIQNGKENQYFTSALMYELEPVLAETKARKKIVKRYNDFSDEEILAAGEFPYIRLMCDGYEELRKLLRAEFSMSDEQVRGTIQNLWVLLQYNPNPFHILQEILPPISSIDQLQKLASVVMRFSNNSPRWILKGFSPSEVNNL